MVVFPGRCEFCEFDRVRFLQEKEETTTKSRKIHSPRPIWPSVNRHSGARYHLVEMYSVNGGLLYKPLQLPRSASLIVSPESKMFSLQNVGVIKGCTYKVSIKCEYLRFDISVKNAVSMHMFYRF